MKEEGDEQQIIDEDIEREELNRASDQFMVSNSVATLGAFGEEGRIDERGRRSNDEKRERERGIELRNRLRDKLATAGKIRPDTKGATARHSSNRDRHNRVVLN